MTDRHKILIATGCALIALILSGCASPYQGQANHLTSAYQAGQISTNDYHARMNEISANDLQYRRNLQKAFEYTPTTYNHNVHHSGSIRTW